MKQNVIEAALGKAAADIIFKNAKIVDVFSGKIINGDVAVKDGIIAGLGVYNGENEVNLKGKYLIPGLIDSHMHIESTMLKPSQYARLIAARGVTTLIADPHEIANVCGAEGIRFMVSDARKVPVDFRFMLPSCVPATPFEPSGAKLDAKALAELKNDGCFQGLAEMMNAYGVVNCDPEVLEKLELFGLIDGHAPGYTGRELCAYAASGVRTDHECSTAEEMTERIALGMYVCIREGSLAKNCAVLSKGLDKRNMSRVTFCTDDRNIHDIVSDGSITNCIRIAIKQGVSPIDAVTIATRNAAECYRLTDRGAVAPGYIADLAVCDSLEELDFCAVYKNGVLISDGKKALFDVPEGDIPPQLVNTVKLSKLSADALYEPFDPKKPVIEVIRDSLITGFYHADSDDGLNLCAVIERHGKSGSIGKCRIKGIGLKNGAIAQSIGHDSHNITVLGASADDMAAAVNALGHDGGIAVVRDGKLIAHMPLPIAGIISEKPYEEVEKSHRAVLSALGELEYNRDFEPLMLLSFLSLPVIPELKLTSGGLFDVRSMQFVKQN